MPRATLNIVRTYLNATLINCNLLKMKTKSQSSFDRDSLIKTHYQNGPDSNSENDLFPPNVRYFFYIFLFSLLLICFLFFSRRKKNLLFSSLDNKTFDSFEIQQSDRCALS